jgi:hypothetical protein
VTREEAMHVSTLLFDQKVGHVLAVNVDEYSGNVHCTVTVGSKGCISPEELVKIQAAAKEAGCRIAVGNGGMRARLEIVK